MIESVQQIGGAFQQKGRYAWPVQCLNGLAYRSFEQAIAFLVQRNDGREIIFHAVRDRPFTQQNNANGRAHQVLARERDDARPGWLGSGGERFPRDIGTQSARNEQKALPTPHPVTVTRHCAASGKWLYSRL